MNKTIIITTDANHGLDSPVSTHFGKSPYFVVARIERGEVRGIQTCENRHFRGHQLGLMHCASRYGYDVILAGGMEPRVAGMFQDLGVEVRADCCGDAKNALDEYLSGAAS